MGRTSTLALLAALTACGGEESGRLVTRPLASDGTHLRDAEGRVALLRGINARVRGVFDVTFSDGRTPLETIPELTQGDCDRMRQLGFDLLRLPINWSGVEPSPGAYDEAYLQRVDSAVACAAASGMLVVVDLHQDGYSKEIGEDGAPLWAIQPPPTQLLEGPLEDLGDRRLSPQVQAAFRTFFDVDDAAGLQAAFSAMLAHVAARYADAPAVIGFELFNEPDTGSPELAAFHARATAAVRAAAPAKLVLFEPPALRNFTDFIPRPQEPYADEGAVYAPHIYTYVFQPDQSAFQAATFEQLEGSVRAAREEAEALRTPLWIGEFGVGPDADEPHERWMQAQGQLHERYFASNAFWVWKEQSQGAWGLFDHDDATDAWTERPAVIARVSRIHVARVAGTPATIDASAPGDDIRVELVPGSATSAPHLVYIPERFAASPRATCDGADLALSRDAATGLAALACTGVLVVRAAAPR
ncbi:MAG: cellulase family glycosylhydrolase [Deltaproteobacteria bacterium]|nr:cellulase family glycosylhydrolase [Deltaproteobacteria bacterium]